MYEGWAVSPREFANRAAGAGRNAWREIWLLLPGERKWLPASLLRRQAEKQPLPKTVTPAETLHAAAACMAETLKSALALVEHANARCLPVPERRQTRARRSDDILGDIAGLD
jgi:hypothetical protein